MELILYGRIIGKKVYSSIFRRGFVSFGPLHLFRQFRFAQFAFVRLVSLTLFLVLVYHRCPKLTLRVCYFFTRGSVSRYKQSLRLCMRTGLWCSRFRDSWAPLNWESAKTKVKRGQSGERRGGGACNHFFKRPVPVYQLLVYPLIGQIWQIISTLSKRVVPVSQKDSVLNECLRDFPLIGALRKEQKACLVNLARGKNGFAILPSGFGLAW